MEYSLYGFAIVFLTISGALSAKTGGASVGKAILRVTLGNSCYGFNSFGRLFLWCESGLI